MGNNLNGKLGIGDKQKLYSPSPVLVESLSDLTCTKISCGWTHTAVITQDSRLFTWGCGEFGALGLGRLEDAWQPVETFMDVQDVSCGSRHTGIVSRGALMMCGAGEMGQLGTGKRQSESILKMVVSEGVLQVSCGVFHSGFVTCDGEVFLMGGNSYGQLGVGNKKSSVLPVKVQVKDAVKLICASSTLCIASEGLYIWGTTVLGEFLTPKKMKIAAGQGVIDAALGGSFTVIMDSKGAVYSWGNNTNGELGLGDLETRITPAPVPGLKGKKIKKIAAGGSFVICLGLDNKENKTKKDSNFKVDLSKNPKTTREYRATQENFWNSDRKQEDFFDFHANFKEISEKCGKNVRNDGEVSLFQLKQENSQLKESISWYKNQLDYEKPKIFEETFQKLKETYLAEIKSLKSQLESQTVLQKELENDLKMAISHTFKLEQSLSQLTSKGSENLNALKQDYQHLEDHSLDLQFSIENQKLQIKDLQSINSSLTQENSYLKQSLLDLQQESLKLTKFVSDLQGSIENLNGIIKGQEARISCLNQKNEELEGEVLQLHRKNDQVVQTFEREISQRAREFRDKTLNILTTQRPRNLTPDESLACRTSRKELSDGQRERMKIAVNRIIDTDSVSPVRTASPNLRSPDRPFRNLNQEFPGKTPNKSDVQNKINNLIQNRSRIEQKLLRFNQEHDLDYSM
jgi:flagellar motor switch/type III secretory pathway protein FliN